MPWREARIVAAWEFRRYFKWKDQLLGFALFLAVATLGYATVIVARAKGRTVTVAVADWEPRQPDGGRLRFAAADRDPAARVAALREGQFQGLLTREESGDFVLLVAKDPRFRAELTALLDETVRREQLEAAGLTPDALGRILAPARLEIRYVDAALERRGPGEKIVAGGMIAVFVMAVLTSLGYLLTGITGEKQLRVTESVVAAISPYAWIDGKILGIGAYSLVTVLNGLAAGLILALGAKLTWGFTLPPGAVRPGVVLTLLLFSALGLLLWNSFFAAIASTIDDPNTSARTSLMFLPVGAVVLSLVVLRDPDGTLARALALFPLTSAPAMPLRLVLSDPGTLEILAALALLTGGIWLMRRLAGRVFEVGMLLYGQEPSLWEIGRWAVGRSGTPPGPQPSAPSVAKP